jgi:hypothetical protein
MMKKVNWHILIPIFILFLVGGYYVVTTSSLVRFWADDFCSSNLLHNTGFWKVQSVWFNGWTGRYSATFLTSFVELFGMQIVNILPIILFTLFLFSLFLIFGLPVSLLLSVIFLLNSPNIIQSFYWMTGSLNYFAPFIFLNFYISMLFGKSKKYINIIAFILMFIAVGFSESFGVASVLFFVYLYLVLQKTNSQKLMTVGVIATILSLGLMYLAPGNAVRSSTVTHPDGLVDLLTKTFVYSKWYLIHLLYIKEFVISVLTIIAGAFVFCKKDHKYFENPKKTILYSFIFAIGITFAVVGLTYQAMNWEPPMRVMTIVNYMIIYSVIISSISLNQLFAKYIPKLLSKVIFIVLIVMMIFQVNTQWGSVRQELKVYASGWDKVETILIDAPDGSTVDVGELKPVGKLDGFKENKGWVSSCIAGYYNLDKLEYKQ